MPWVLAVPGLLLILAVHYTFPLAGSWYAFTKWNGLGSPKVIGLANFREIIQTPLFRDAIFHTVLLAGCLLVVTNGIGLALALALNRGGGYHQFLRSIFFLPVVVSPVAVAFIWRYVFDYFGPLNDILGTVGLGAWKRPWLADPHWAIWMVLLVMIWQYTGLAMIFYLAGLQTIPDDLFEAASVDGASGWRRFRRITLPLLAPAITVSWTITLLFGLRVFDQILALTDGGPAGATETLATQVWRQTFVYGRFGLGAALALTLAGLVAVVTLTNTLMLRARERAL